MHYSAIMYTLHDITFVTNGMPYSQTVMTKNCIVPNDTIVTIIKYVFKMRRLNPSDNQLWSITKL